jgi:hypothetical protein
MENNSLSRHELRKAIKTINNASERTNLVQKLWQAEMYRECLDLFQFEGNDPLTIKSYLEVSSKIYLRQFLADGNQLKRLLPNVISYSNFLPIEEREVLLNFIGKLVEKQTSSQLKGFFTTSLEINETLRKSGLDNPINLLAPQVAEHFDLHDEIYQRLLNSSGNNTINQCLIYYKKGGALILAWQFGFCTDLEVKLKENYSTDITCLLQLLHNFNRSNYEFDKFLQKYDKDIRNDFYLTDQILFLMLSHFSDLLSKSKVLASKQILKFLTALDKFLDTLTNSCTKVTPTLIEIKLIAKLWLLLIELYKDDEDEDIDIAELKKIMNAKHSVATQYPVNLVVHEFLVNLNVRIVKRSLAISDFEVLELLLLSKASANESREAYFSHLNQSISDKYYCRECSKPHYRNLDEYDIDDHLDLLSKAAKKKSLFDPVSVKTLVVQLKAIKKECK